MRYLITGHAGFIGSHLVRELHDRGHQSVGIDIAQGGSDLTIPGRFRMLLAAALEHSEIDAVIHLAAQPGRVFGEEDMANTIKLNVQMTAEVARACGELGVRLIYTSTSEIYGNSVEVPLSYSTIPIADEETMPSPINLYGLTKLWGEQVSELYAPDKLLIIRPMMPYGPGMEVGRGRAALPTFIWQAMTYKTINVHPGAKRSWCYIDDMIRGFADVVEKGRDGIYNVGRDDDLRDMTEIAHLACDVAGVHHQRIYVVDPDPTITLVKNLSTERLRSLGWKPQVSLEEGMRRTYESLKTRMESLSIASR